MNLKKFKHLDIHKDHPTWVPTLQHNNCRYYGITRPDGDGILFYPSVTTICNWSGRKFFAEWRSNPANEAYSIHARTRGEIIHKMFELYLSNSTIEDIISNLDEPALRLFRNVQGCLDRIDKIRMLEACLWSHDMMFAGRVDCIAEYNGVLSIIDFKGSQKFKSPEYITSYYMQETAYAAAYEEMFGTEIKQIVTIIAVEEENTFQVFVYKPELFIMDLEREMNLFWKENTETIQRINYDPDFRPDGKIDVTPPKSSRR